MTEKRLIDLLRVDLGEVDISDCTDVEDIFSAVITYLFEQPTVDAVELPCKIGDTVWAIRCYRGVLVPQQGKVSEMLFTTDMKLCIVVKHICRGEWGKKVFATMEEANVAIGERRIDNGQAER